MGSIAPAAPAGAQQAYNASSDAALAEAFEHQAKCARKKRELELAQVHQHLVQAEQYRADSALMAELRAWAVQKRNELERDFAVLGLTFRGRGEEDGA